MNELLGFMGIAVLMLTILSGINVMVALGVLDFLAWHTW